MALSQEFIVLTPNPMISDEMNLLYAFMFPEG